MKTFTRIIFLLLFSITTHLSFAQLNYQVGGFSNFSSTYTDLGTTGTAITMNNNDSGHSVPQAIGFTFNFNSHPYDSFVMYVDGFIKLGNTYVSSDTNMNFTAYNQPPVGGPFNSTNPLDTSLIFPLGNDYWGAKYNTVTPSFRVSTTGTNGSRVCTIQWKNLSDKMVTLPVTGTTTTVLEQYDTINFQLKLYEGTNAIEFVYGTWIISSNTSQARFGACGIKGNNSGGTSYAEVLTITKGSAVAWSGGTANSQTSGSPYGNYTVNALNFGNNNSVARPAPDPGRTYHFGPVVYNDAAVVEVRAMGKVAISAYVPDSIRATIYNSGINALTSLPVTLHITGANIDSAVVVLSSIASGGVAYVAFPPFNPTNVGAGLITVTVPPDDNNTNNNYSYSFSASNRTLGYTDTTRSFSGSGGSSPIIYACKYRINGTRLISSVKIFIPANSNAQTTPCTGVIIDLNNNIIGTSVIDTLTVANMGTYVTFNIVNPPVLTNTYFYAGISVGYPIVYTSPGYFLSIYQNEGTTFGSATNSNRADVALTFPTGAATVPTVQTVGRYMIEAMVDPDTTDVGISASIPANNGVVPTGVATSLRAYVKNFGTVAKASGLSVKYSLDGGAAVGPLSTTVGLNQNDTTSVYFTGTNAFTLSTAGTHTIKIYTSYATDQNRGNDTLVLTLIAVAPITTYPYRLANGILTTWTPINNSASLWAQATAPQPNGVSATTVLYANNTGTSGLPDAKMQSPIFSFVGITHPTLHFYVAHAPSTTSGKDDTLQVLVSTNGGATYSAVYTKSSQLSSPTLGTVAAISSSTYTPASASDWRHETVDLSAYSGNSYVVIAFREKSAAGGNVYVSDIIVSNPATLSTQAITTTGTYTSGIVNVGMTTAIGASTGQLSISRYTGAPFSSASPVFATNSSATTNSGGIFTPNNVSPDNWWTITYSGIGTGNLPSTVPYYLIINYSTISGITRPDSLYIMKRSENNGSWIALNTTRSSSTLLAGPITGFSDYAIGSTSSYNALPVSWLNVSAKKLANSTLIEWSTASEINNNYFVVERSINGNDFISIGKVASGGNQNTIQNYSYTDNDLIVGVKTIYYRIRQIDNDGASTLSKVVLVNIDEITAPIFAYPNPFTKDLQLSINSKSQDIKVAVTDLSGREVYNKIIHADANSTSIKLSDLNTLENGFYLLNVLIDGVSNVFKINKTE